MGAAVSSQPSSEKQPKPNINVTPLVDVVLVLLIIFMVIAPQLENGERVELPTVTNPDPKSKSKMDPITVSVTAAGTIFVEKRQIMAAGLALELTQVHEANPSRRVVLKGDAGVPFAKMREVFAIVQQTGFPGVALSVNQRGKGKSNEG